MTGRLVAAAVVGAVGVALVVAVLLRSTVELSDAQQAASRSEAALTEIARTERLVVDLETGLRGWIITGENRFLAPYRNAARAVPLALIRLERAASGVPAQRRRVEGIEASIIAYQRDHARPLLAQGRPPTLSRRAREIAAEGKRRLDLLRAALGAVSAFE
ncbi:MAG: CHASE3 domain-containing protein, partial [Actinomycetota bacterium]|nr:CHASE3 domain-containing protein [Actinomycetota bacterium]